MTRLHLKYVQSFGGYHYFRRRGSPRISLPGVVGSAEFMAALSGRARRCARRVEDRRRAHHLRDHLCASGGLLRVGEVQDELGAETRRYRRNVIEKFRANSASMQ